MAERPRAPSLYALPPWPEEPLGSALSPELLAEEAAYGLTHDVAWAYAEAIPALVGGDPSVDVIPLAFRRGAIRAALVEAPVVVPGLYHAETTSPAVAEALRGVVPSVVVDRASPTAACWAFQRPVARRFLPVVPLDFDVWLCWDRTEARACVVQGFSTIVEGRWGPRGVAPEAAPPPWAEPDAVWGGHGWAASLLDNRSDRTPKRVSLDPARGFLYLAADAERGSDYPARVAAAWRAGARPFATASEIAGSGVARDGGPSSTRPLDGPTSTTASAVCAALRFVDGHAELAWIGDGRVLRLRGDRLERLTRDHDIADALARGDLVLERCPPEALRALVRTLPSHAPETCRVAVEPGDRFVLLDAASHAFLEARLGGHDALRRFLRGPTSTAAPATIAAALRDAVAGVPNAYPVVIIDADAVIAPRAASSPAPIAAELRVVWGAELRRPYFLTAPARIGRGSDCDIVLDDDGVSRHHAQITPADGGYLLTDLGATNGIWVNHARLAPGTPHRLGEGDLLTLGAHRLQFWLGHRTIWEPHLRRHDVSPILAALAAVSGPNALVKNSAPSPASRTDASLVLLDIDRLYRLNRLHPDGLLAGDAALAQVEALARASLGAADTFARIGGDRFAIVLPGRGREEAHALAEAVRRAIDEGHPISVTVSVGVASWSPSIGRPWQLLREAEARLTDARLAGRNRVCGA